ncbi:MAG: hypothetical protein WCC00_04685 [Candidatus Aminicenantales bacterium]
MRKSSVFLVVLMAAVLSAAYPGAPQKAGEQLSERDQWAADLDFLAKELPARHKNLFFKITPVRFQAEVAALKARIPELGRPQFLVGLARLVATAGDSHTSLTVIPQKAFPLKLYWFKEGICVTDTTPEYAELLNGRLAAVDGHPVEEVVRAFSGIIPHDNEAQIKDFVPRFLGSSEHLIGLGLIAEPEEATVSVRTPAGGTASARMRSLPRSAIGTISWAAPAVDPSRLPLYRRTAGSAYEFAYLAESRTLYFAYNSCRDLPDRPFAAFAAGLWDTIRKNPVDRLVIDLRNNGGGDSSILDPFIGELAAAKEINRKGRLFVIVGRRTFSSAILNALDLRKKTEAVFYGEPTGGKPNHYGEIETLTLPHLKLGVSYSTKYFQFVEGDDPSLMPDVLVELTLDDYLALRDPALEAILAKGPVGR